MEFIDKSEIPKDDNALTDKETELFFKEHEQLLKCLKRQKPQIFDIDYSFRDFWLLCENPIPFLIRDYKYRNRYIITRDTKRISEVIKMPKEQEMNFIETTAIPKMRRGKKAKDWLPVLQSIPVGKVWVIANGTKGISTLRASIITLEKAKKVKVGEYVMVQRTENKVCTTYVTHEKV